MKTASRPNPAQTFEKQSITPGCIAVATVPGLQLESASQEFMDWTGLQSLVPGIELASLAEPVFAAIAPRLELAVPFIEIFADRTGRLLEIDVKFLNSMHGPRAVLSVGQVVLGVGSPEILEALLESAGVGHAFIDREGKYCRINNVLAKINGFPVDFHIGKRIEEIIPTGAGVLRPLIERVFETGEPVSGMEVSAERPTIPVSIGYWQVSYNPIRNESTGEIEFIGAIVVDVTERKIAEKMLLESEKRFRSLAENSPDIIIRHGKDFRYKYVSPQIEKYLGIAASEVQGKSFYEVGFEKEQAAFFEQHLAEAFRTGKNHDVEYSLRDGQVNIYSRLVPEFDDQGNVDSVMVLSTEISERKKAELQLLRAREDQESTLAVLESLLENAPIGFAFYDEEYRFIRINRVLAEINGHPVEDHIGRSVLEIVPGLANEARAVIDGIFKTGIAVMDYEMSGETPKMPGITRHWITGFYPVFKKGSNEVDYVGVVVHEITERKEAEARIRESESRFRLLAETIPQMIWTLDPQGNADWSSRQWRDYSGVENPAEAWNYMIHPDDKSECEASWAHSLQTGEMLYHEIRLRNSKGEYRFHTSVAMPARDASGKILKWVGSLTDVHDRRTFAEELKMQVQARTAELRNTEQFLETVLDSSVEMVASFDPDLNYTFLNKGACEFLGKPREEVIGKNLLEISPSLRDTQVHKDLLSGLKGERIYIHSRAVLTHPGHFVENFVIPIYEKGTVTGCVTLSRDISEVLLLTDKLSKMVEELQRSNEDLQQFAHVASHDLKEPVRKALTFASRLRDEYAGVLPEKGRMYIEKMESAAGRMYNMIEGVLTYSTVSAHDHEIDTVDLNEVIGEIISDLELPLQSLSAKLEHGTLPQLQGSRLLLYQLFYNLVNNALKFANPGLPPVVSIVAAPSDNETICGCGLNPEKNYYTILVRDNGIGFSDQDRERIFGTFTRIHAKDKYEGTGLGLALCKKIAERHGGCITAKGTEGLGAEFRIILPG